MIHEVTKDAYVLMPCRCSSVAFWKAVGWQMPAGIRVVHASEFADSGDAQQVARYFRLAHDLREVKQWDSSVFTVRNVDIAEELELVSHMLSVCYESDYGTDFVAELTKRVVFEPDLWVWAVERASGLPVGLGIGEFDEDILEGCLEWVQVLPTFRGRGIGTLLVWELLGRLQGNADFVTVSGEVGSAGNPEGLYRKCGFFGEDVWCVVREE